jgi:hypothetical protein
MAHLSRARKTVFEHLDDAGLRTACTTYLIYRGRTRHEPSGESMYRRLAAAAQFRHAVYGARELFYADLFDSRNTGCTSALGMPGQRDRHTGCVGAYLVEHDLFDFLLFSLPDNDTWSHRYGPDSQLSSIAEADRALERIMHVAGGAEAFLEDHAVIVMSDHSQTAVEGRLNLADALRSWRVLGPADPDPGEAGLAVCPAARSAMLYVLDEGARERLVPRAARDLEGIGESSASRPAATLPTTGAGTGAWRGASKPSTCAPRTVASGSRPIPTRSDGCGPPSSAPTPGTYSCRPPRGTSSWTGAAQITSVEAATDPSTRMTPAVCCWPLASSSRSGRSGRSPT